ncbi:MAG: leucine-rich repeat domain-containing protein [Methylococcaceae bacterium]|jgi:internalin A
MAFSDLSPLSGLANLQELSVWNTNVSDLSPLSGLANLQKLVAWDTHVTNLTPLSGLANLQELNVLRTRVTDLSPLSSLAHLKKLNVSHTLVTDLSPLSGLANLKKLDVSRTLVTDLSPLLELINNDLPVLWSSDFLKEDLGIFVLDCPWTNPPAEIVKQGNTAILNFFQETAIQKQIVFTKPRCSLLAKAGQAKPVYCGGYIKPRYHCRMRKRPPRASIFTGTSSS